MATSRENEDAQELARQWAAEAEAKGEAPIRRGSREALKRAEEFFRVLSPEAEAIRDARPDLSADMAELRAIGWRGFDFTAAEIRSWLLSGFDVRRDMYAAALRDEGVSPEMLIRDCQRFGSSEVRSLIEVVLGFIYEPAHPGDLTRLLDNWMVERVRRRKRSRVG